MVLAASPNRGRALVATLIVLAPVALVFSHLLDAFDAAHTAAALHELQQAAVAAAVAGGIAVALSLTVSAIEWQGRNVRLPTPPRSMSWVFSVRWYWPARSSSSSRSGNPITSASDRIDSISSSDEDYSRITGSRFTYEGGLNRVNFWHVALGQAADDPLAGGGAGSFRSTYLVEGTESRSPAMRTACRSRSSESSGSSACCCS